MDDDLDAMIARLEEMAQGLYETASVEERAEIIVGREAVRVGVEELHREYGLSDG